MQHSESPDEDLFSGFESGLSEYASAESTLETAAADEGAGGTAATTPSHNDDDFFDAFVDADGAKPAEGDSAVSRENVAAGESAEGACQTSSGQPEMNLFFDSASEVADQPAPSHDLSNGRTDHSNPAGVDPFCGFNDANTSAAQKIDAVPVEDDFFGAFVAGNAESPPVEVADPSFAAVPVEVPGDSTEKIGGEREKKESESAQSLTNSNIDATETRTSLIPGDFDDIPSALNATEKISWWQQ